MHGRQAGFHSGYLSKGAIKCDDCQIKGEARTIVVLPGFMQDFHQMGEVIAQCHGNFSN